MNQQFLCPVCRTPLINEKDRLACSNDHEYHFSDNVLILLEEKKRKKIDEYIAKYFEYKKNDGTLSVIAEDFQRLPYIRDSGNSKEWKFRKYSLEIINKLTKGLKIKTALEFGPYNGWLTNQLVENGFDVTAIDYFNDELTGLKAIKHYNNKWLPVQMDIRDLSIIRYKYDLIIFNHSLHFFNSYANIIKDAKELLNAGGVIIILGIPVYKEPASIIKSINATFEHYLTEHQFDFNLFPDEFRGYFDLNDKNFLERIGLEFIRYPQLKLQNLIAEFNSIKPKYYYGIFKKR
jgi:2-polyprenyl-3-methyl-5-hydroxy-6-metoxy-1,4-benzoquinol methylase